MSKELEEKRQALLDAYAGSISWKTKVKKMSDDQVLAIYLRLQTQGRIK